MKNNVGFLTTVFPMSEEYLNNFFTSLASQSYSKFDIILINDGYEDVFKFIEKFSDLSIIEVKSHDTPAKNREKGINFALDNDYEILVFGDSDDYFKSNRIEKSISLLNDNDIVVNDLTLFNNHGVYEENYLSNRIKNNTIVNVHDVKNKNIFGFTNTAIRLNNVPRVIFSDLLIATDWFFFTTLLLLDLKAIFTNSTCSFYRQYDKNTLGINKLSPKSIELEGKIKLKHYESFPHLASNLNQIKTLFNSNTIDEIYSRLNQNRLNYPFWLEETRA